MINLIPLFKVKATCSIKSNRLCFADTQKQDLIVAEGLHQFVKPITPPRKLAFCALEVKQQLLQNLRQINFALVESST